MIFPTLFSCSRDEGAGLGRGLLPLHCSSNDDDSNDDDDSYNDDDAITWWQ